jgi:hypothetical protein
MTTTQVDRRSLVALWVPSTVPIAAWAVHLVGSSALARVACTHHLTWVLHVLTAATALVCVGCGVVAWRLASAPGDEEDGTPSGRTRFLGLFGLLVVAINLVLILLEGSYVLFLSSCG